MAEPTFAHPPALKRLYEAGMRITFEPRSGSVVVRFRGRVTVLPGVFGSEDQAVDAGETFCRQHGWRPTPLRAAPAVVLRTAW